LFTATSTSTHVLAPAAMSLADGLREQLGPGASMFCVGRIPPEFVPGSFTLGPSHSVEIGASSFTVRYNGVERKISTGPLLPGWIPLPVRYTPLDVPGPTPVRRHFLVSLIWWSERPDAPSAWNLGCTISEIVGADFLPVTAAPRIVVASGARPPDALDVDRMARVFVNANGDVEWQTGTADTLRSGLVPRREPK